MTYSEENGEVFLGRQMTQHKQVSDETAHAIDEEIRRVIDMNYKRAKEILETNLDKLHTMADALVKYETIDETQIKDIMSGKAPKPPADWDDSVGTPAAEASGRRGRGRRGYRHACRPALRLVSSMPAGGRR